MLIHALSADIIDISCLKLTQGFYIRRSFQQRPLSFRAIFYFTIKCIYTHQTNFSRKQWLQTGPLIYKFMKCREKEKNRFNSILKKICPLVRKNCLRNLIYWSIWWGVSFVPFPFWFPFQLHWDLVNSGIISQSVHNNLIWCFTLKQET